MMMKILCIADAIADFKIEKDSTYLMLKILSEKGHVIHIAETQDLFFEERAQVQANPLIFLNTGNRKKWYDLQPSIHQDLTEFDVILMRKDPPYDMEYIYACHFLKIAEEAGVIVLNSAQVLQNFSEKLSILNFPDLIAPTLVTKNLEKAKAFVEKHQKAVVKPLDQMGGADVFLLENTDVNYANILQLLFQQTQNSHQKINPAQCQTLMIQRFIPEIKEGDKRILIIGEQIIPLALARIPKSDSIRGNLASGGHGRVQPLSPRDWHITKTVHIELKKRGIFMAGIDVIGDFLTEINITSPTCMQEIGQYASLLHKQNGQAIDLVEPIIDPAQIWYDELLKWCQAKLHKA
jgi:glutathione synthase